MSFLVFAFRMEILYGIYDNKAAVRVGDFKLITGETYTPPAQRPLARGEMDTLMKPVTVWDSEIECANYPDAIGCWPDISPCLFNVRFDPCEKNNVAYFMPQTVEALAYSMNKYNESAVYRSKRDIPETGNDKRVTRAQKRTIRKLQRSIKTLDRNKIRK